MRVQVRYEPGPSGRHGSEGQRLVQTVELVGDLTAEHRARLEGLIERCPTHKTLSSGIPILDT
ncbi:MAG: OsmC family protein [Candidatus Methylomirabilales bacterium]